MDWLFSDLYHLIGVVVFASIILLLAPFVIKYVPLVFAPKPVDDYTKVGLRQVFSSPGLAKRIEYMHLQEQGEIHGLTHEAATAQLRATIATASATERTAYQSLIDDHRLKNAIIEAAIVRGVDTTISQQLIAEAVRKYLDENIHQIRTETDFKTVVDEAALQVDTRLRAKREAYELERRFRQDNAGEKL